MSSVNERHKIAMQTLLVVLKHLTDIGALDALAAYIHPDIINKFCDGVKEMAEE